MKKVICLLGMYLIAVTMYGQAQSGNVVYQRVKHDAAVIELPYSPDMVNAALNDYLSKKGKSKVEDIKGFTTYRSTQPVTGDSVNANLYFKVERKSRQQKENAVVSLLLNKPVADNAAGNVHHMDMEEAKTYLNELLPAFVAYDLEQTIKDQNKTLIDAEAKLKGLQRDNGDLKSKIENLQKDLENNNQKQQAQLEAINQQKQKLAELVSQRKA